MKKHAVIVLIVFGLLAVLPFASGAFSSEHPGCGGKCSECHTLDKKEAEAIIKKLNPALTVIDVKPAQVKSLWQIDVDAGEGKRGPVFLDFSKKYLLVISQIIAVDSIGKPAPKRTIDFSKLPLKEALVMGPKDAKKKVAVFTGLLRFPAAPADAQGGAQESGDDPVRKIGGTSRRCADGQDAPRADL
jgi:thiol:disulfide interchange protein DsbC